jgi:uncharacterized protein (DUF488 family)
MTQATLVTVGHGTLGRAEFGELLRATDVELIVDIRSHPGSRRHPHFARDAMQSWLPEEGVDYRWFRDLGGRRKPSPDSRHTALEHPAFRGYADYMESTEFHEALVAVLSVAAERRAAVMCSESVWWRCHRRLLSDAAVLLHGTSVEHLFHDHRLRSHPVMAEARVEDGEIVYDQRDLRR